MLRGNQKVSKLTPCYKSPAVKLRGRAPTFIKTVDRAGGNTSLTLEKEEALYSARGNKDTITSSQGVHSQGEGVCITKVTWAVYTSVKECCGKMNKSA